MMNKLPNTFIGFTLTAVIFLLIQMEANGQIVNPDGDLKKVSSDEIWAQTLVGSRFNELWTYHFYLNDEIKVYITYLVANFGSLKSPVSGLRMSVINLDGELFQLAREVPLERLVQDKENHMFRLHPEREIYFQGELPHEHKLRINTRKDGVTYDIELTLENMADGVKWDDGKFMISTEQIGILTHIPYAEVTGFININGKRKEVHGTGYMDHTYQHQTTTRLMHSGYRYVSHQDPDNWEILFFLLPKNSPDKYTIGYHLSKRNGQLNVRGAKRIKQLEKGPVSGRNIAKNIELELDNSDVVKISRSSDDEMFSVFDELGRLARRLARTFLGGEVIDFRGEAVYSEPGKRPKRGLYNFFIVD